MDARTRKKAIAALRAASAVLSGKAVSAWKDDIFEADQKVITKVAEKASSLSWGHLQFRLGRMTAIEDDFGEVMRYTFNVSARSKTIEPQHSVIIYPILTFHLDVNLGLGRASLQVVRSYANERGENRGKEAWGKAMVSINSLRELGERIHEALTTSGGDGVQYS